MNKLHRAGAVLTRGRELYDLPPGTIVQATSSGAPCYFIRYGDGFLACDRGGDVQLHMDLWADLDGWPVVLRALDLLRPATVISAPARERTPA